MIPSAARLGGKVWGFPPRMTPASKKNHVQRLVAVDRVISAINESGVECKALDVCNALPKAYEMSAKDKYTTFARKGTNYRKWMHRVPHFTKITLRTNPAGY